MRETGGGTGPALPPSERPGNLSFVSKPSEPLPDLPRISVNWKWIIATAAATVVAVLLLVTVYYPQIPDPMPIHWNAAGEADGFQPKSLGGFLGLILIGPGVLLLSLLGASAMVSMQSSHITGMGGAKTANEAHRTWLGYQSMMNHLGWFIFTLNLLIMIMLVRSYSGATHPLELTGFLIVLAVITGLFLQVLFKEQKAAEAKYPKPEHERGKTWGIFHNDPEDKRILVDTGGGTNFTFNIGRPVGRILAILLFGVLPLGLILFVASQALAA